MAELYNGTSDSFGFITDCYVDYAEEVICRRALPDLRDGQKKVTRRILYSTYMNKKDTLQKCIVPVSDACKLHPHGDQAVYGALTLLTDENGSCNMPLYKGLGNLGKVFLSKKPADMRYPKVKPNENLDDFFRDKDVMHLVPAEEGEGKEPEVLNAIYPVVLVNGTMGIAVAVGTRVPSFNFGDVVDLTVKYLKEGKLEVTDVIVPDFPTGGILVRNDAELAKIMATGKGKLKIRAKVEIQGNLILVQEVPYGKTVENIINLIKKSGIKEISAATNTVGRNSQALLTIECKSKKVVDYVLKELYRRNILQHIYGSNIVVTEKEVPFIIGVHTILERWCAWRKSVVIEKSQKILSSIENEIPILDYFIRLCSNPEWKRTYTETVLYEDSPKSKAEAYLKEIFDDIPDNVCNWIYERGISAFNRGGAYAKRLEGLLETKKEYEGYINNPEQYIIDELLKLKQEKAGMYERKTEVTYTDYKFSKISETEEIEDDSWCMWTLLKSGFLIKSRQSYSKPEEVLCEFGGQANSILMGFDNFGRVLRVVGKEIPYTPYGENGTYLPKYFEATFQEDYKILYMGLLDGSKKMLVYRDGYVGFFDTAEYVGKKNIKIISKGICTAVYDKLLEVYEEDKIPEMLLLADDTDGVVKVGIIQTSTIPERSRTSRAKIFSGDVNTKYILEMNGMDMYNTIERPELYMGKVKRLKTELYANEVRDGKYLDICVDFKTEE